jgi:uncharacterized membrane protein (UPF0127 family)
MPSSKIRTKKNIFLLITVLVVILACILVLLIVNKDTGPAPQPKTCLDINGQCVELERLETSQEHLKGLSGRDYLPAGTGMLFAYSASATECMWMKDMRFSIDIVWLDESKFINKIEQNVSPETYPKNFCQDDTMYVIELNAGDVEQLGLQVGQKLSF